MQSINEDHNFYAILGPTNTGKTYYAFERLLAYNSGIFGFPLRSTDRASVEIVQGIELNDFAKSKIKVTTEELLSEKEAVKDLLN